MATLNLLNVPTIHIRRQDPIFMQHLFNWSVKTVGADINQTNETDCFVFLRKLPLKKFCFGDMGKDRLLGKEFFCLVPLYTTINANSRLQTY